jgi:integrase
MRSGAIRWQAVWIEPGPGRRPRQRTKNFGREKDARAHANQMEVEIERKGVGDPERHTVERYLRRWLATLADRGEHSPTTLQSYRRNIDLACRHIGHMPLEKLSPADLDQLYATLLKRGGRVRKTNPDGSRDQRGLNPRTVLHIHRVLHTAFGQARKWRMIAENPAKDATAPSPRRSRVRAFTYDEVQRLIGEANDDDTRAIAVTLLVTGLRRSELLALAWDAVDLDAGTINIRRAVLEVDHAPVLVEANKTEASERTMIIPQLLVGLLREQKARVLQAALLWGQGYRREPMLVFPRPDGEPRVPQSVTDRLKTLMRQAKVEARSPVHAWRHTCATLALAGGADLKTIQTRLGHSTPNITMALYISPTVERDAAAAESLAALVPSACTERERTVPRNHGAIIKSLNGAKKQETGGTGRKREKQDASTS